MNKKSGLALGALLCSAAAHAGAAETGRSADGRVGDDAGRLPEALCPERRRAGLSPAGRPVRSSGDHHARHVRIAQPDLPGHQRLERQGADTVNSTCKDRSATRHSRSRSRSSRARRSIYRPNGDKTLDTILVEMQAVTLRAVRTRRARSWTGKRIATWMVAPSRAPRDQSAVLEHGEHGSVVGQDLGEELPDPGLAGDRRDMMHQDRAEAVALIVVDDRERHFGLARFGDDEAGAADDFRGPRPSWRPQSARHDRRNRRRRRSAAPFPRSERFIAKKR